MMLKITEKNNPQYKNSNSNCRDENFSFTDKSFNGELLVMQ